MSFEIDVEKIKNEALQCAEKLCMNDPKTAESVLEQYLIVDNDDQKANKLMGIVKLRKNQFKESIAFFQKVLDKFPDDSECYNDMALAYAADDDLNMAQSCMQKAIEINPDNYYFYSNLALHLRQKGNYKEALNLFDKAISINPKDATLWINKGGIFGEMKQTEKARECFEKALEIDPNSAAAHVDKAFSLHLEKKWKEGFEEFEWRFSQFHNLSYYKNAYDPNKKWDGKKYLNGKRTILYCEQGMGDAIHFIRYAKMLKKAGSYNIVHCAPALDSMFQRIEGVDETFNRDIVNNKGDEIPEHDYHCSIMSLPHLLDYYEIDGNPYMDSIVTFEMKEHYKDTYNIGISWAGSPAHANDKGRSFHLSNFRKIHNLDKVKLFSLQTDIRKRMYFSQNMEPLDLSDNCEDLKIVDLTTMIQTFEDSATFVTGLDLVISCDTALVHLCGALGVECWACIPYNCDWRWGLDGETTEWYNSVRLFRQPKPGDWDSVFNNIKEELSKRIV